MGTTWATFGADLANSKCPKPAIGADILKLFNPPQASQVDLFSFDAFFGVSAIGSMHFLVFRPLGRCIFWCFGHWVDAFFGVWACESWGGLSNFKMSAPRAGFGHFEFAKSYAILYIIIYYYMLLYVIISCAIVDFTMSAPRAAFGHFEIIPHRAKVSYVIICYYII